jgi:hypothetical protein
MTNKIQVRLQCLNIKLSANEILNMIDKQDLNKIKEKDDHPFFQAYSFCHEGLSKPRIIGNTGEKEEEPVKWTRKAVQSLKNVIIKGIKFFKGHNKDNSIENRNHYGEVIANKEMEIKGKLHHVIVGYFPDKEAVKNDDIVSQEGLWNFVKTATGIIADSVEKITGIALGNSEYDSPAFEGAHRLGTVQCFEGEGDSQNNDGGDPPKKKEKTMNLQDVINYIRDNKVHITQLPFTIEDIKADRNLGKIIDDLEKENQDLKKFKEDATKEKEEYEKQIKEFKDKDNLVQAKENFKKLLTESKADEKEKKYIELRFGKEKLEDMSEKGLKEFYEKKAQEYKDEIKPLLNDKKEDVFEPNGNAKPADPEDMTKAENNELLEEDYNPY